MNSIKGVYRLVVYDNGIVDLKAMPFEYICDNIPLDEDPNTIQLRPSQKASQIIQVLQEIRLHIPGQRVCMDNFAHIKKIVSAATKKVAAHLQITEQSVSDKYTRGLGITKDIFVELVIDFYTYGFDEGTYDVSRLYETISEAFYLSTCEYDMDYVNTSFINTLL